MEKFNYHDTFAVGKNSDGKLTIYHISNKKASNLTDPHNNTTPAKRIQVMLESGFSKEISEKVGKTLKQGFDDVSDVKQSTVRKCKEVIISDDLASFTDATNKLPKYNEMYTEDEEVNQQNQYKEGFKNRKKPPFPKPNSEESEMFDTFGWDKNNPPEEAYDYFAKRELFADKKLAAAKNDPDHVFYKTGKSIKHFRLL